MDEYSIIIEYETEEGREEEFVRLLKDHARRSLEEDSGCTRFDILKPVERTGVPVANRVIVTGWFSNEAALRSHEENPRLERLRSAYAPLLKSRRLILSKPLQPRLAEEGIRPEHLSAANDD